MKKINLSFDAGSVEITPKLYSNVVNVVADKCNIIDILSTFGINDIIEFYGEDTILESMDFDFIRRYYETNINGTTD